MRFKKRKNEVIEFTNQYGIRAENQIKEHYIKMELQIMEEVNDEFIYLGSPLCKCGSMEGKIRERDHGIHNKKRGQ